MNKTTFTPELDDVIRQSYGVPEIWSEFVNRTYDDLMKRAEQKSMPSNRAGLRLRSGLGLAAVMIAVVFFLTPQGQAMAQGLLHFFTRARSDIMPGSTEAPLIWVEQTPGIPAATSTPQTAYSPAYGSMCGKINDPKCTFEQIQAKVTFPVFQLSEIPNGLFFAGATGGPQSVYIVYQTENRGSMLIIHQVPNTKNEKQTAFLVGASAEVETIQVDGITAEYVKGAFFSDGSRKPATWTSELPSQSLRWVNQGIFFDLEYYGVEPELDRDDLVVLISSLTTESIADITPIPTLQPTEDVIKMLSERYSLSVDQVEQKAGFSLYLPTKLPKGLAFMGAYYESDLGKVVVFYNYTNHFSNGLLINQQPVPESGDCALCGFDLGEADDLASTTPGNLISREAKIETVQIGNSTGGYVEGVWFDTDKGWVWDTTPRVKRLRWSSNGMAYVLEYFGMEITKEDMLSIAESIN